MDGDGRKSAPTSAKGKRRPPALGPLQTTSAVMQPVARPLPQDNIPTGLSHQVEVTINDSKVLLSERTLKKIRDLGKGQYGIVELMLHEETNYSIAVKKIRCSMDNDKQRRILNDLDVSMRSCYNCPYVIISYGALFNDGDVWICMELMDFSLDIFLKNVYDQKKIIPEKLLAYIAFCVVSALEYLHKELKVIHRDVKPSNILTDRIGRVKVCDFGISGDLTNSMAKTNVGSELYLAPERIDPQNKRGYRIQSDVWSLGISLLELATGKFPYARWGSVFHQLKDVVEKDSPTLSPDAGYSDNMRSFIAYCLVKKDDDRPNYVDLLEHKLMLNLDHKSLQNSLAAFVQEIIEAPISGE